MMIEIMIKCLLIITLIQYSSLLPVKDSSQMPNYNRTSFNRTDSNAVNSDAFGYLEFKRLLIADFEDQLLKKLENLGINITDGKKTKKKKQSGGNGVHSSCSNGMSNKDLIRASRHFKMQDEFDNSGGENVKKILVKLKKSNSCYISMDGTLRTSSKPSSLSNSQQKACFSGELPIINTITSIYSSRLIIPSTSLNETAIRHFNYLVSSNESTIVNKDDVNVDLELPIQQFGDYDINNSNSNYINKIHNNNNKDLQYNITELMTKVIAKKQIISKQESTNELYSKSVTQLFNLLLVKQYSSKVKLDKIVDFNNILLEIHYTANNVSLNRSKRNIPIHESLLEQSGECSSNSIACCRNFIWIQSKDLKFGKYVFAPASFQLYYCEGACPTVLAPKSTLADQKILPKRHQPCCAPSSYKEMRIIARSIHNQIKIMTIPSAIVGSCRCL